MKLIAGFLSSVLVTVLFMLVSTIIFQQTLLNPTYIKEKLRVVDAYTDISRILPKLMTVQIQGTAKEREKIEASIAMLLTPEYLERKGGEFFDQLQKHLQADGPVPAIDITELAKQARAQGLEIPDELTQKPVPLSPSLDANIQSAYKGTNAVQLGSFVAASVLFILLLLICVKLHSYGQLVSVFLSCSFFSVLTYFSLVYAPGWIMSRIPTSDKIMEDLMVVLQKVLVSVMGDISQKFLILGIVFGVVGLVIFVLSLISHARYKTKMKVAPAAAPKAAPKPA